MRGGRRATGAHRTVLPARARVAAVAAVALLGLGGAAVAAGTASAATGSSDVLVVGRVCSADTPPGTVAYRGSGGDAGRVSTDRGRYAFLLRHVARGGERITGTATCPGPRGTDYIRAIPFSFTVDRTPAGVVVHDIR